MTVVRPPLVGGGSISQHNWWCNEIAAALWAGTVHLYLVSIDVSARSTHSEKQCFSDFSVQVVTQEVWVGSGIVFLTGSQVTSMLVKGLHFEVRLCKHHLALLQGCDHPGPWTESFVHLKTDLQSYFKISLKQYPGSPYLFSDQEQHSIQSLICKNVFLLINSACWKWSFQHYKKEHTHLYLVERVPGLLPLMGI